MKIVVINSTGPMGSSVVGAIVEKFGYLNAPIRNLGLNRYLISKKQVDKDQYKKNFLEVFTAQSKKMKLGGLSMLDRDSSESYSPIDRTIIEQELLDLEKKEISNFPDLYEVLRCLYGKSIEYKNSKHFPGKNIEYTTYFDQYPTDELSQAYVDEFKEVVFIHMHRDFIGWMESTMSQYFSGPLKWRIILLHALHNRWLTNERKVKDCPGLHLNFETLFTGDKKEMISEIASELDEPVPDISWEDEYYDLYGRERDFSSTFTLVDVEGTHLSAGTRKFVRYCLKKKKITRFHDVVFYLFCLYDVLRFVIINRR